MPFTFSHPAIVLSLAGKRNKYLSATGLIIGSMTPDFESFISFGGHKIFGHTWLGMFWFDLPLGVLICCLFHGVVRDPVISCFPVAIGERFSEYRGNNWFRYFADHFWVVLLSLMIGVFSHLVWDAFTHLSIRDPDSVRSTIRVGRFRLFILLQYFCSVLGLLYIAWFVSKLPRIRLAHHVRPDIKFRYWLFSFFLSVLCGVFIYTSLPEKAHIDRVYVINLAISSVLFSISFVSFIYKFVFKPDR